MASITLLVEIFLFFLSSPVPIEGANLMTMPDIKQCNGVKVDLYDHTMGFGVAVVAAALGATLVEKHFYP